MADSMFDEIMRYVGDNAASSTCVVVIFLTLIVTKLLQGLLNFIKGALHVPGSISGLAIKRFEHNELLKTYGLHSVAKHRGQMLKQREVLRFAREKAGMYIPNFIWHSAVLLIALFVALLSVGWILQQVSQVFGDSPQIQAIAACLFGVFYCLACVLLLLVLPLIVLLDIGTFGALWAKLKIMFKKLRLRREGSFDSESCLKRGQVMWFVEGKNAYVVLCAGSLEPYVKRQFVPGMHRVAFSKEQLDWTDDVSGLEDAVVLTCSWDGTEGFDLMIELRKKKVNAYYIGLLSDAWVQYYRFFIAMHLSYEEEISSARPMEESELPSGLLDK